MSKNVDGGPAFPRPHSTDEHDMPCNNYFEQDGMSLRDWFAGMALQGLLIANSWRLGAPGSDRYIPGSTGSLAQRSYEIADAMIKEREK